MNTVFNIKTRLKYKNRYNKSNPAFCILGTVITSMTTLLNIFLRQVSRLVILILAVSKNFLNFHCYSNSAATVTRTPAVSNRNHNLLYNTVSNEHHALPVFNNKKKIIELTQNHSSTINLRAQLVWNILIKTGNTKIRAHVKKKNHTYTRGNTRRQLLVKRNVNWTETLSYGWKWLIHR